jgi:hypothetical protein
MKMRSLIRYAFLLTALGLLWGCGKSDSDIATECQRNMQQFHSAKRSFAMERGLNEGTVLTPSLIHELGQYVKGGWEDNQCPAGGTYTFGAIGEEIHCSIHGTLSDLSSNPEGK